MKIATWNINGVRARLEGAVTWLKETSPDVACFQEIKSADEAFPAEAFEELGYNVAVHGQKGFNGVAILSKLPFDEVAVRGLPGDEADTHARYIEVMVTRPGGVGAGRQSLPAQRQSHRHRQVRLQARLDAAPRSAHAATLLELEEPLVLIGDYNVIPEPVDAKNPQAWTEDALFQPETRAAFRSLAQPWPDRRLARLPSRARHLHVLGLSGRRLAEGPRHPHRSHPGVAAGRRPPRCRRRRQVHARLGEAL